MHCYQQPTVVRDLQIMHNSGLDVTGFTGVPIFQAAGLTVKTKDSRRTPLFLDKNDLDAALGNAYSQKITQRDQATRAKVDRAQQDLADATKQVFLCAVSLFLVWHLARANICGLSVHNNCCARAASQHSELRCIITPAFS